MFSHIMVGTNDIDKARDFYNAVLGVVGAPEPMVNENATGQTRLFYIHNDSIFCVSEPIDDEPAVVANGSTIGIACGSPEQVRQLHDTAVASGGTSIEQPPGPRDTTMGALYLCYFRDLDGHKICGLHRPG
jgi:catechol 2,3-dioxygenase-like lactoylglutathione lyase family enzyme